MELGCQRLEGLIHSNALYIYPVMCKEQRECLFSERLWTVGIGVGDVLVHAHGVLEKIVTREQAKLYTRDCN